MSDKLNNVKETLNGATNPRASEFGNQIMEGMKSSFSSAQEYTNQARGMAERAGEETVGFIKRNPVNTTIGVGIIGLLAGWLLGRRPRK